DRVAEACRDRQSCAVASRLRQRPAAGREDDGRRLQVAAVGAEAEPARGSLDAENAAARNERRADASELAEQRLEHITRAVRVRKKLAARFLVQAHADLAEEGDRLVDGEGPKHAADDGRPSAPEVALGDGRVRDVAARPAAHEDLGARFPRAVEEHDRRRAVEAAGENGGRETGGAGADHRDVARSRKLECQRPKLTLVQNFVITPTY